MVDLTVVVVLHLELAGHVSPRPRGVSVCLDSQDQPGVSRNSLAVETFLTEGDVVVHTAGVVASDALYEESEPSVAGAGIAGQAHQWQVSAKLN